jgi:molybdopterin/thiamine biosynthesis adenylyltransferase
MDRFDRQIRVFGQAGQRALQKLVVGIVGLGGIGSVVFLLLVRSGVKRFVVVDPDEVEITNLNRLAGSTMEDVKNRTPKVDMLAQYASRINHDVKVSQLRMSVSDEKAHKRLRVCDTLFGCTDNESSRDDLNCFSVKCHIPYFDTGTGIQADEDLNIQHAGGQVRIVIPSMGCLRCIDGIALDIAQQEQLPESERQIAIERGYIAGADEPAPAVASLNGVIANLAVAEFKAHVTGFKPLQRYLFYDFMNAEVVPVQFDRDPNCIICSPTGSMGIGDVGEPLPLDMLIAPNY